MTIIEPALHWDPYDIGINTDPYPLFKRLREESPLYYNEELDFYAVTRYADVERALKDRDTFISGRGGVLEIIKSGLEMPSGIIIFEDPPSHTIHRALLSRMFTPRKVARLEPQIRAFCADALDPLVGSDGFDVIEKLAATMPARVIGMLMGIPDADSLEVRYHAETGTPRSGGMSVAKEGETMFSAALEAHLADYVAWRAEHPSDDIMTELLNVEFEDEQGVRRTLTRQEVATYCSIVLGAGNETTTRLIGWACKLLAEHPDQRRQLVDDPALVPQAVEEMLRFEPPPHSIGRYVTRDVEFQGQTVPAGSAILNIVAAANRDEEKFPDGETFDINRKPAVSHFSLGHGAHFCLGAGLARLEGRIAVEELLVRFPEWDVDLTRATLSATSLTRGWDALPLVLP